MNTPMTFVLLAIWSLHVEPSTSEPPALVSTWVKKPGRLNVEIHDWVNVSRSVKYVFNWTGKPGMIIPLRISIEALNATQSIDRWPLIIVAKQDSSVLTMTLPYLFFVHSDSEHWADGEGAHITKFNRVTRTLCPQYSAVVNRQFTASVEISSSSPTSIYFTILASPVTNFALNISPANNALSLTTDVEPSAPQYYLFDFSSNATGLSNVEAVRVVLNSTNDDTCLAMAIQHISCPVWDTPDNVDHSGQQHQMILTKGDIYVKRKYFKAFYLVLVSYPNSSHCRTNSVSNDTNKSKPVTIEILPAPVINPPAIVAILVFWFLFVLFSFLIAQYYFRRRSATHTLLAPPETEERSGVEETSAESSGVEETSAEPSGVEETSAEPSGVVETSAESAHLCEPICRSMSIEDLNKKQQNKNVYILQLVVIFVFYTLPVVQLIFNLIKTISSTGNLDSCYFNYACSIKLSITKKIQIYAFNNVLSNIGYLAAGLAFMLVCASKQYYMQNNPRAHQTGVPDCYSLYYACGATVIVEGIMSAAFHICPSRANFQFDSAFMVMLAGLLTLLLYSKRHPDINPRAHIAYLALGAAILTNTLSILFSNALRAYVFLLSVVALLHMCLTLWIAFQMYYFGELSLQDFLSCRGPQNFQYPPDKTCQGDCCECCPRHFSFSNVRYPSTLVFSILFVVLNFTAAGFYSIYTAYTVRKYDTIPEVFKSSDVILGIMIINFLLYLLFYLVMKLINANCKCYSMACTLVLVAIVAVFSALALYFFFYPSTNWGQSPDESRSHNTDCLFWGFDVHDMWHFLSAGGLFWMLMLILCVDLDDDGKKRGDLPVY